MAKDKYIWVKLTKEWGGFDVDETVRIGLPKGANLVEAGIGREVPEPADEKKKRLKVEAKAKVDAEAARLAVEAKAAEEAEAKAKADAEKKTAEKATHTPDAETADNRPNPKETTKK